MKKLLIALLVGSVLLMPVVVLAESAINPGSDYTTVKMYAFVKDVSVAVNSSPTGDTPQVKAVPTTTIKPNDTRIIGFTLVALTPSQGAVCSLHDVTATADASNGITIDDAAEQAMSNSTLITEAEVAAADNSTTVWFAYPKKVTNQLAIMVGQAYAAVIIYYI